MGCRSCPRCWKTPNYYVCHRYTTWLCHRCAPGRISACAPGCCTQLPHRRRNRLSPWRRCSTGCCGTDVPGIRTPTPVSGGSSEQSCQPCPHFRVCLSVAVTVGFSDKVSFTRKGFILSPCVPLVPLHFHQSGESVEIRRLWGSCECKSLGWKPLWTLPRTTGLPKPPPPLWGTYSCFFSPGFSLVVLPDTGQSSCQILQRWSCAVIPQAPPANMTDQRAVQSESWDPPREGGGGEQERTSPSLPEKLSISTQCESLFSGNLQVVYHVSSCDENVITYANLWGE